MRSFTCILGAVLIATILWETFESIVLPRGVTRQFRLTRLFYFSTWSIYSRPARNAASDRRLEGYLSIFGPLSLIMLLTCWALILIFGFALIQYGLGSHIYSEHLRPGFISDLYLSGTTFSTLGLGDATPATPASRFVVVTEAGVGFGFLAILIGYLPVLYQAFSRREVGISLLDARSGSPPSAGELLRRHADSKQMVALTSLLATFETWCADMMESHLSFAVLGFYRSQHDRESWLFALAAILDTCALLSVTGDGTQDWEASLAWQSKMTFAMARHAVVDLSLVFNAPPFAAHEERLTPEQFATLSADLTARGLLVGYNPDSYRKLGVIRAQYEPYINAIGRKFLLTLPQWHSDGLTADNWQTTAWGDSMHL